MASRAGFAAESQPEPASTGPSGRGKYVSEACEGCQRKRRRCTGNQPCLLCLQSNIDCVFAAKPDGRRKDARKRKVEDMQNDSDLLYDLLRSIRDSDDAGMKQILSVVRSNASVAEVKVHIKKQIIDAQLDDRDPSPELEDLDRTIDAVQQQATFLNTPMLDEFSSTRIGRSRARSYEEPPIMVPASPWTQVTRDDDLVSHLVSVWNSWDGNWYDYIDLDLFLKDMRAGDLDCDYCSPMLVNALLAMSCFYSDYAESKTRRGKDSRLSLQFLGEATRLLADAGDGPSLLKAQTMALLNMAFSLNGQDSVGYSYVKRAYAMCLELQSLAAKSKKPQDEKNQRTLHRACWGIFAIVAVSDLCLHQPMSLPAPDLDLRLPKQADTLDWTPYPRVGSPRPSYKNELLNESLLLMPIVREIPQVIYVSNPAASEGSHDDLQDSIFSLHTRLLSWYDNRRSYPEPSTSSAPSLFAHE